MTIVAHIDHIGGAHTIKILDQDTHKEQKHTAPDRDAAFAIVQRLAKKTHKAIKVVDMEKHVVTAIDAGGNIDDPIEESKRPLREMSNDRYVVIMDDRRDLKAAMALPNLPRKVRCGYNEQTSKYEMVFASKEEAAMAEQVLSRNKIRTYGVRPQSRRQSSEGIGAGDMCNTKGGRVVVVKVNGNTARVKDDVPLGTPVETREVPIADLVKRAIGTKLNSADLSSITRNPS